MGLQGHTLPTNTQMSATQSPTPPPTAAPESPSQNVTRETVEPTKEAPKQQATWIKILGPQRRIPTPIRYHLARRLPRRSLLLPKRNDPPSTPCGRSLKPERRPHFFLEIP